MLAYRLLSGVWVRYWVYLGHVLIDGAEAGLG